MTEDYIDYVDLEIIPATLELDIEDFDEVVKLDLEYIDNWSLSLDFKILLQTVGVVLLGRGAK